MRTLIKTLSNKLALAPLFVTFLALPAGCDSDLDAEDYVLSKGSVTIKSPNAPEKDLSLSQKLQPYIRCINSTSKRVDKSRQRYRGWIKDLNKGPTCKERYVRAPYKLTLVSRCTTDLEKANAKKPSLPKLEKAAATFSKAVRQLEPLLDQAYNYYSGSSYRRDKCALGQKLHPKLMAAFELANGSDLAMRNQVDFENGRLQKRRLARTAQTYGKNHPRYHRRFVMHQAKLLLKVLRMQAGPKAKIELPKIQSAISNYEKSVKSMGSAPASTAGGVGYSLFKSQAKTMLESANEFLDRKRTGKKWTRIEARWLRSGSGWLVKGSFARVLRRYNRLVDRFNSVRFRRR